MAKISYQQAKKSTKSNLGKIIKLAKLLKGKDPNDRLPENPTNRDIRNDMYSAKYGE